jgi:hypothetical protein
MKAITAAVIAILNVNIRFRPLAHGKPLTAERLWDRRKRETQPAAARLVFEPADDFGKIPAPRAGSEIELRNIRTKFAESDPVPAMQFRQKIPRGSLIGRKGRPSIPDRLGQVPCSAAKIPCSLS